MTAVKVNFHDHAASQLVAAFVRLRPPPAQRRLQKSIRRDQNSVAHIYRPSHPKLSVILHRNGRRRRISCCPLFHPAGTTHGRPCRRLRAPPSPPCPQGWCCSRHRAAPFRAPSQSAHGGRRLQPHFLPPARAEPDRPHLRRHHAVRVAAERQYAEQLRQYPPASALCLFTRPQVGIAAGCLMVLCSGSIAYTCAPRIISQPPTSTSTTRLTRVCSYMRCCNSHCSCVTVSSRSIACAGCVAPALPAPPSPHPPSQNPLSAASPLFCRRFAASLAWVRGCTRQAHTPYLSEHQALNPCAIKP